MLTPVTISNGDDFPLLACLRKVNGEVVDGIRCNKMARTIRVSASKGLSISVGDIIDIKDLQESFKVKKHHKRESVLNNGYVYIVEF
jgi:hypothetical protein